MGKEVSPIRRLIPAPLSSPWLTRSAPGWDDLAGSLRPARRRAKPPVVPGLG